MALQADAMSSAQQAGMIRKYLTRKGCKFSLKVFGDGEPVIATEGWKDAFRIHLETGKKWRCPASVHHGHSLRQFWRLRRWMLRTIPLSGELLEPAIVKTARIGLLIVFAGDNTNCQRSSIMVRLVGWFPGQASCGRCARSTRDGHKNGQMISFAAISASSSVAWLSWALTQSTASFCWSKRGNRSRRPRNTCIGAALSNGEGEDDDPMSLKIGSTSLRSRTGRTRLAG